MIKLTILPKISRKKEKQRNAVFLVLFNMICKSFKFYCNPKTFIANGKVASKPYIKMQSFVGNALLQGESLQGTVKCEEM